MNNCTTFLLPFGSFYLRFPYEWGERAFRLSTPFWEFLVIVVAVSLYAYTSSALSTPFWEFLALEFLLPQYVKSKLDLTFYSLLGVSL